MNNFFIKFLLILLLFFSSFISTISNVLAEPGVSVFMYHRFDENKYPSTNVTQEQFSQQIKYILENNIKVLALEDVIKILEDNEIFREKYVAFSVDDAYRSFYENAWPIFRKYSIPVTLFVSTDIIDKNTRGYMSWDEIKQFIDEGGTVGQHTASHMHMPLNDIADVKIDILNSHKSFIKNLGFIPKLFAYPYGESSNEIIGVLKEFGISHSFGQHSGVISSYDNLYYLPRFSINERFGEVDRFEFAVNSHSLNISNFIPSDMFLFNEKKPLIEFSIINDLKGNKINCFSNPGGNWDLQEVVNVTSNRIQVILSDDFEKGRARLNCTTRIDENWHWFGYQFLVR